MVQARLYDINGDVKGVQTFYIPPHGEFDLLVHEMPGFEPDSYGKICSIVIGGNAGEIDGRMVLYRLDQRKNPRNWDQRFDFAFGVPFANGIKGIQAITYNTYQPSLDPRDKNNLVANWIQISNLEETVQEGTLVFYRDNGQIVSQNTILLPPGGRRDFAAHQIGPNLVGYAEWQPSNPDAKFRIHNSRYFYDNPYGVNTFATALQFDGVVGNGQHLVAPLDAVGRTAVVEISNTLASSVIVDVYIYNANGVLRLAAAPTVGAHSTLHVIADPYLNGEKGSVLLVPTVPNSIVATAIQYTRTASGGVDSMYAVQAREVLGSVLESNYNTWLGQTCRLILVNPNSSTEGTTISLTRDDGTVVMSGYSISVPPFGTIDYDLCGNEEDNNIGIVRVFPDHTNKILATQLRIGNQNDYQFSTPVR